MTFDFHQVGLLITSHPLSSPRRGISAHPSAWVRKGSYFMLLLGVLVMGVVALFEPKDGHGGDHGHH